MGVHGLSSYILQNSSLYLKHYELSDCYVVLDGNNIAHNLAKGLKSHSAFGGDYDEYFAVVKSFMLGLKKCNICPIVLFDGGCEKTKIKARLNRRREMLMRIKCFCQGFSTQKFFPIFMVEVFVNMVMDMGFTCIQCDLEADGEIAAVARLLNCPVLSDDSDYFIYDVMYIPFSKIKQNPLKYSNSDKYYIECLIYNVDDFLETIGLDKPLLPILANLLGNDHVDNLIFFKFFNHVRMPKNKNKSRAQKRISGLIDWLKNENLDSALNSISRHLKKTDADKVSGLFRKTINYYSPSTISEAVLNELSNKFGEVHLSKSDLTINWPPEIARLHAQRMIPGFLTNIVLNQLYLTPLQVENINDHSAHFKSLNLIRKIYTMLTPYLKASKPLQLYLIIGKQYTCLKMHQDPSYCINLDEVLKEPRENRLKLLCDTVGVPADDFNFVQCNSWAIFIMSFIYWVKEFNNSVTLAHIHAFVIMMIANQIVQTKVGYYRNSSDFMKRFRNKLKLGDQNLTLEESSEFSEMLSNVKHYECLVVQKELIPFRQTTEKGSGREYCLSTIHLFNCFQSCLYHIMIINGLLNFPLPYLRVEDFYSGTLLFNLYIHIKSKPSVELFGAKLFLQTPNLNQIYKYLFAKLTGISQLTNVKGKSQRRKKTKKKDFSFKLLENVHNSSGDEEFIDENNLYALLHKIHL